MKVHSYRGRDRLGSISAGGEDLGGLFAAEFLPETGARRHEAEAGWTALLTLWAASYLAVANEPAIEVCSGAAPAAIAAFAFRHAVHGSYAFPSPTAPLALAVTSLRRNEATRRQNIVRARMGKAQSRLEPTALDGWIEDPRGALRTVLGLAGMMLVFRYSDLGLSTIAVSESEATLDRIVQSLSGAPEIELVVAAEHRQLPTR